MEDSIGALVEKIRAGDDRAVHEMWDAYFERVVRYADGRLRGQRARQADGQDVAQSVLGSVVKALRKGRFEDLPNRDQFWRVLASITRWKVIDLVRYNQSRPAAGESVMGTGDDGTGAGLAGLDNQQMPPDLAVCIQDEWERLVALLPKQEYQRIAVMRLQGFGIKEIAEFENCHPATIERWLRIVRLSWQKELDRQDG